MNRNILYALIAVLAVAAAALGYELHHERQNTSGVDISIGDHGISVEKK